jgi:hypothetical protein
MSRQVSHLAQICLQVGGGHKGLDSTLNSSTVLVIEREKVRNQTACDYKVKTAVHSNEHQIVRLTPTFLDSFNSDLMPLSISLGSFRFFYVVMAKTPRNVPRIHKNPKQMLFKTSEWY